MPSYRTMRGKEVDMDKLLEKNQLMPAVGNAKMNARGDELGPGGKIVKKREDTVNEYYENNPAAIMAAKQSNTVVGDSVTFSKDKK
jgi:hypothetical protein